MIPRYVAAALTFVAALTGLPAAHASCARAGNPKALEVELLSCTTARAYFEDNYEALHPAKSEPAGSRPVDPRHVFANQLTGQPGVVIEVKILQLREYADTPEYSWLGPWERKQTPEIHKLYLRQPDSTCGSIEKGAIDQLILAPQCCDTGYFGEIGCHLGLGMVQRLPHELANP